MELPGVERPWAGEAMLAGSLVEVTMGVEAPQEKVASMVVLLAAVS